jgi:bifunctional enzyme CysN/CysC
VHIASDRNLTDLRLPVQWVIRPMSHDHHDYRGYAGQLAGGTLRPGDDVVVLPSGRATQVESIDTFDGPVEEARPPMALTVHLADDIDISRGDMICRPHNQPVAVREFDATLCWMSDTPMSARGRYLFKHTTRSGRAIVDQLHYKIDTDTLHRVHGDSLELNEIGRITLRTSIPVFVDEYRRNRTTGSFILIDEATNDTVGAGMILGQEAQPFAHPEAVEDE